MHERKHSSVWESCRGRSVWIQLEHSTKVMFREKASDGGGVPVAGVKV